MTTISFAAFNRNQHPPTTPSEDTFGETEDKIRADEEQWEQQFAASREQLRNMGRKAAAEFRVGESTPMTFLAHGQFSTQ